MFAALLCRCCVAAALLLRRRVRLCVRRDTFHHVNGERVRVTRDPATGAVLACIIKRKPALANVDFYCPGAQVTFRISACYEDKVPMPPTEAIETRYVCACERYVNSSP